MIAQSCRIVGCVFTGNTAIGGFGGAFAVFGPVRPEGVLLSHCLLSGNVAGFFGGGVSVFTNRVDIASCTFAGNNASNGGGLFVSSSSSGVTVANTVLWGNTDDGGSDESAQVVVAGFPLLSVDYCCVQGLSSLVGIGNIDTDPLFVDPDGADDVLGTLDDDLRLMAGSSCIDAGDNDRVVVDLFDVDGDGLLAERVPLDIAREFRFQDDPATADTGAGLCFLVDIGAHEFDGIDPGAELDDAGSDWFDPASWNRMVVPHCQNVLTISGSVLIDAPDAQAHSITVQSGAVLTIGPGTLDVTQIIVESGALLVVNDPSAELTIRSLEIATSGSFQWTTGTVRVKLGSWQQDDPVQIGCVGTATLILDEGGRVDGPSIEVCASGEVRGNGTLGATTTNGGLVGAGLSPGQLFVEGDYEQTAAGTLTAELGGTVAVDGYDVLTVSGNASLAGTLDVDLFGGFEPMPGDPFGVLTCSFLTGEFDTVDVEPIPGGFPVDTNYNPLGVTLSIGGPTTLVYVDFNTPAAPKAQDGETWATAYADLQDALSDTLSSDPLIEIRVAQGVYRPAPQDGDPSLFFDIFRMNGRAVLGGYAGNLEPDPHVRDIVLHETILSGDLNDDDGGFLNNEENSLVVVGGGAVADFTAVLDGVIIEGGNAPADGGGLSLPLTQSPTIVDCTVRGNMAGGKGGGAFVGPNASPSFTRCLFEGNVSSNHGAGAYVEGNALFSDCVFSGNQSGSVQGGGAISVGASATVTVADCTLSGNTSAIRTEGQCNVFDSDFVGNDATFDGGAVYLLGGMLNLTNCMFDGNSATQAGALIAGIGSAVVVGCDFTNNMASSNAGAIFVGGTDVTVDLVDCNITGNVAGLYGGGLMNFGGSTVTLTNVTMSGNSAPSGGSSIRNSHFNSIFGTTTVLTGSVTAEGQLLNHDRLSLAESDLASFGDYEQSSLEGSGVTATMTVELGGTVPGVSHGQLAVVNAAQLSGGLFVSLSPGYTPVLNDTFPIITAGSVIDQFDVAFLPALPGGLFMFIEYGAGAVGPAGGATIIVENLDTLFAFDDPDSVGILGVPTGVVLGDFDNQDGLDLAITLSGVTVNDPGSVLVLLNDGTGQGFAQIQQITVGLEPSGITVGFLDADGDLDIAVTNAGSDNVSILLASGFGDGTFNLPVNITVGDRPSAIAAGDFGEDGSGDIDLAVANEGDNNVQILTNDGAGTFNAGGGTFLAGIAPVSIRWDDLDDNKDLDLVVSNQGSDDISVFLNAGGGSFDPVMNLAVGDGPVELATGDFDLDGNADIITANNGDGTVSVILNNGDGTFVPAVNLPVGALPRSLTPIDLEGDLDFDIAVIANDDLCDPVVQVLRNDLTAGQLIFAAAADLVTGTDPAFVISGDLDGDLNEDLITVNDGLGAAAAAGGGSATAPPGPAMGSVNVSLNALVTPCPPDVNGDGVVNVLDLIDLLLCFGQPAVPVCQPEDVNGDGTVNVLDLIDLLLAFGTSCP